MGNTIILINDAQLALDILDKRSTYSSRSQPFLGGEMYVLASGPLKCFGLTEIV